LRLPENGNKKIIQRLNAGANLRMLITRISNEGLTVNIIPKRLSLSINFITGGSADKPVYLRNKLIRLKRLDNAVFCPCIFNPIKDITGTGSKKYYRNILVPRV